MKRFVFVLVFTAVCALLSAQAKCPCCPVVALPLNQTLQQVVPDGTGGAISAWEDLRNGLDYDIYAQRIDTNGNMLWPPNGIEICGITTTPGYQGHLCITPSGGNFIIAWEDGRNGADLDIYAQMIDLNGNLLWAPATGLPSARSPESTKRYPRSAPIWQVALSSPGMTTGRP
jgi:hypothetical protein